MKKIKVSDLFNKSTYHETVADEELIKAVMEQSKLPSKNGSWFSLQNIIIFVGLVIAWILIYNIYTIIFTDRFYELTDNGEIVTDTGEIYNPNWEKELIEDIDTIFNK